MSYNAKMCNYMFRNAPLGAHDETHDVNRGWKETYLYKYREKA